MSELDKNKPNARNPNTAEDHTGFLTSLRERRINWPASVVASLAATAMATYYVHGRSHKEGSLIHHVDTALTWKDHYTVDRFVGTSYDTRRVIVPQKDLLRKTRVLSNNSIRDPSERWAEHFAQDPHAGELTNQADFVHVVDSLKQLVNDGYDIHTVEITGFASAEDDQANAGLRSPSAKNHQLAHRRAVVVAENLKEAIKHDKDLEDATQDTEFIFGAPQEEKLSKDQIQEVEKAAKQAGFANAKAMIQAWNRAPESVPAAQKHMLDHLLANHRKVNIKISSKNAAKYIYRVQKFCVIEDITNKHYVLEKKKDNLPWPIPVPILIPRFRRKKTMEEQEAEDVNPPEPTPPVKKAPPKVKAEQKPEDIVGTDEWYERISREVQERRAISRRRRMIAAVTGAILLPLVAAFNIDGKNCQGHKHGAEPWFINGARELMYTMDIPGGHRDNIQDLSFGVPFVDGLQLKLVGPRSNLWGADGLAPCRPALPNTTGGSAKKPSCAIEEITERNGKVITSKVVKKTYPLSTRTVTQDY